MSSNLDAADERGIMQGDDLIQQIPGAPTALRQTLLPRLGETVTIGPVYIDGLDRETSS